MVKCCIEVRHKEIFTKDRENDAISVFFHQNIAPE